mmetsp:Transcript_44204/g.70956  ORF Transcript_44204/g.70956 Transcript_44204/m.70956 type:complete len:202 (+) Transcript_44204:542-1147(+)
MRRDASSSYSNDVSAPSDNNREGAAAGAAAAGTAATGEEAAAAVRVSSGGIEKGTARTSGSAVALVTKRRRQQRRRQRRRRRHPHQQPPERPRVQPSVHPRPMRNKHLPQTCGAARLRRRRSVPPLVTMPTSPSVQQLAASSGARQRWMCFTARRWRRAAGVGDPWWSWRDTCPAKHTGRPCWDVMHGESSAEDSESSGRV